MNHWFTRPDAPIVKRSTKRFAPQHWTINFPRGAMGAIVSGDDDRSLTATAVFLRKSDLVGLIFESEDRHVHVAHRRETSRDYTHCQLRFRWQSEGLLGLDAINGPTLTIEGKDSTGASRSWFVRMWHYASGTPSDATIAIDFDQLDAGFSFPADKIRVDPKAIDRMFISLVPPGFVPGDETRFASPTSGQVTISDIRCDGSGSVLAIGDAIVPPHDLRICTAYDDMYDLAPERIFDSIERLGFRKIITHYIGMSHYFALGGDGLVRGDTVFNPAALAWHAAFAAAAARRGYDVIWSFSYEILDMFCPEGWKQRDGSGAPAHTGYDPPSTLISPASAGGMAYLRSVAVALSDLAVAAGLSPKVQIGEPWWWVTTAGEPCLYDIAARAAFRGNPVAIGNVRGAMNAAQKLLLDAAGGLLAQSTAGIVAAVRAAHADAKLLLLAYLPDILLPEAPELRRANLPVGWSLPAFDVAQFEDYAWVTEGKTTLRRAAITAATARLGYPDGTQHYLSGFAGSADPQADWKQILSAADEAHERGVAEVFLWALPQVFRDGLTLFGEERDVQAFDDVLFPIEIGMQASVSPAFSTSVVTSASGFEYRNANWSQAQLRFDAGPGVRGDREIQQLLTFFRARRGSAVAFRFRDPYDWSSSATGAAPAASDQLLGRGDGARIRFGLVKNYAEGEARTIRRPRSGTVRVSLGGIEQASGWLLEGGTIVFDQPPASNVEVGAGFEFDVPVRFEQDRLDIHRASFLAGEAPSVPLIEIREDAA